MSEELHRCGDPALQAREEWIASIPGPGWAVPLEMQQRAMFPHLCSYAKLTMLSAVDWYIVTPSVCWQP